MGRKNEIPIVHCRRFVFSRELLINFGFLYAKLEFRNLDLASQLGHHPFTSTSYNHNPTNNTAFNYVILLYAQFI